MKKVSVLMPIYNTPLDYLKQAIESVLKQTYRDFELLILNDSPDNIELEQFVLSIKDERIIYTKNEKNMGITPSRNKLIEMATSEYLMIMDHDDISMPTRIEKQVEYLDTHNDVGVVGCFFQNIIGGKVAKYPVNSDDIEENLMFSCAVAHSGSMVRKRVLVDNNISYEEMYSPAEDYALYARLIGKTKFYNIPEILYHYRNHAGNTSHRQKEKMDKATFLVYDMVRKSQKQIWEKTLKKGCVLTRVKICGIPFCTLKKTGEKAKRVVDKFYQANVENKNVLYVKFGPLFSIMKFVIQGKKITGYLFGRIPVFSSRSKFRLN